MAIIGQTADAGPDTAALTVANSGGGNGTACETPTSPGALIYSTAAAAHGAMGIRSVPQSGVIREGRWNFTAAQVMQFRGYFYRRNNPTAAHTILQIKSGATTVFQLAASASNPGRINVQDATGSPLFGTSASNTVLDTLYRVEFIIDCGTTSSDGSVEFRLYPGESTTPQASYSSGAAVNLGGPLDADNIRLGHPSGTTSDLTVWDWDSWNIWTAGDMSGTFPNLFTADPSKIDFTLTEISPTQVNIGWADPGNAPNGIAILRGPGNLTGVDGNGRLPSDPLYDFSTIAGVSVIANNQDAATDSPYSDTITAGGYTYNIVRET